MGEPHKVVVVGGGAAGLDFATRLARRSRRANLAVTLVDRAGAYVWKPRLHQVAAGTLDTGEEEVVYLAQARRAGFTYRPGTLRALDRAACTATLGTVQDAAGHDEVTAVVPYDTLVLAIGSHADDFGTPGVREHCAFIDSRDQADRFHAALRREVIRSLDDPAQRPVTVAVVGAGATGVELSAELHQALDLAAGYGLPGLRERLRITLVEAAPRILTALPEKVAEEATRVLRQLGVTVLTGSPVASVDDAGVTLKDGTRIEAVLRVWAAGVRAPAVTRSLDGLATDRAGRLLVEPTLRSRDDPRVFALGDCAALVPEGQAHALPATAQVAHQEAAHLAHTLPGYVAGGPLAPFRYKPRGSLVSLGDYDAFGSLARLGILPGGFIEGRLARLSYAALYRQYQWVMHGWRVPLVWLAGALHRLAKPSVRLE